MSLSTTSIRRPVLAAVLSVLLVLFGVVGYRFLGTREYPLTDSPVVTVTTLYTGASPDVIEAQVTKPLEEVIGEANGIRVLSSVSREQVSVITVEFSLATDLEAAANDVRDKVSKAIRQLPADIEPPIVEKANGGDITIFMAIRSDTKSILEVSNVASTTIKERLQSIPGVSKVTIFGEKKYAMRLRMDPTKLALHGLGPADVQAALLRENVDLPSGRIEGDQNELTVRTLGRLVTAEDFDAMVLREQGGAIVRFGDVGVAELAPQNERTAIKRNLDGKAVEAIGLGVEPQRGADVIAIADEFYRRLEQLKREIPKDYVIEVGKDFTEPVRNSIAEVRETLLLAFGLVVLIIFAFLRDWRSTLIPVLAIPVSIVSAFFIMFAFGFTINVLTLLGLVLAIGLVVDDAIVVLENIYVKIENGMTPMEAALKGSTEIYFAVVSTTITLAAVFLPVLFLQGVTGRLFREFAIVVAGSVIVSAFVALTLSPMMASRLLRRHDRPSWLYRATEPMFLALGRGYERALAVFLRGRLLALPILVGSVVLTYVVGRGLPSELAPLEDQSLVRVLVSAPEGSSYEYTEKYLDELAAWERKEASEGVYQSYEVIAPSFGTPGPSNVGFFDMWLEKPEDRALTQAQIFDHVSREAAGFRGVLVIPIQSPTIGSRFAGQPVQLVLKARDLSTLTTVLPKFLAEARKSPALRFVDVDLKVNKPELVVRINREKAARLGVPTADVGKTLQLALSGRRFGYFLYDNRQYEVIGQVQRDARDAPYDLRSLFVHSRSGEMVSLDNLTTVDEGISPAALYRFDQQLSATVSAGLAPGASLGDGLTAMQSAAKVLPPTVSTALAGELRDFSESAASLVFAFVLALALIYLVLAAQFESLVDPFIILLTVPMALAGAVGSLSLAHQTLNVFSEIGIIVLIGLVTKNGILIVEFANQYKERGLAPREAALRAAASRFRPILMTSLATVFGAMPIALSLGASSGSRSSLGVVVVGGLTFAGLLTLFVIPAVYSLLSRTHARAPEPHAEVAHAHA